MSKLTTNRRGFLKMASAAGGGLIIAVPLSGCTSPQIVRSHEEGEYQHSALLQITPSNAIHFYVPRSEMGQGVYHGLTTLIAEELNTPPEMITVHHAPPGSEFNNPDYGIQVTGGSSSIKAHYQPLRQAAADAGAAILNAASHALGVPMDALSLRDAEVVSSSGTTPFGDYAELASQLKAPAGVALKPEDSFRFIGKQGKRIDGAAKSTGTAEFGIDVDFPGLKRAAIKICPVHQGTVKSFDDSQAMAMPGVIKTVNIGSGVAVIAESYWEARQAVDKLKIEWTLPELVNYSSDSIKTKLEQLIDSEEGDRAHKDGAGHAGLAGAAQTFSAQYWAPYIAHATMEPMNCTVKLTEQSCEVWVGCQAPAAAQATVATIVGLDRDQVTLNSTFLGGGFGRRTNLDYIEQAAHIVKASGGIPIQLVWSREDDMKHDYYRPASLARFEASVDDQGNLDTFSVKRAGPNMMPYSMEEFLPTVAPQFMEGLGRWAGRKTHGLFESMVVDPSSVEGLFEDYDVPNKEARHITFDPGLTTGAWRSVGHSFSGFFKESFIDEIAHGTQQDPVEFRLNNSRGDERFSRTLKLATEKANWGSPKFAGASQGVAVHSSFFSVAAQVAEVSIVNGEIKVHRIVCAIDCGTAVNPDIVKTQMESCINFGLSTALYSEITLVDGAVQQTNFHDFPMLRMTEAPEIEVYIVPSQEPPTGVGEPGLPPVAAAVANAIFAATGQRLRSLPLKLG